MTYPLVALLAMASTGGQVADPAEFRAPIVKVLQSEWPNNRTFTIVCHGHSVPAGYFKTPVVQTMDAYPHLLRETVSRAYPHAVVNVVVTAIGGENSESGAKRFAADVLPLKPDVVTIDYSLNDRGIGVERARAAWESMIVAAQKAGSRVILLTPSWDLSAQPESPSDPLFLEAALVRELAAKHHIGLADSLQAYVRAKAEGTEVGSLMSQVNHPNRAGHKLILRQLLPWFGVDPK